MPETATANRLTTDQMHARISYVAQEYGARRYAEGYDAGKRSIELRGFCRVCWRPASWACMVDLLCDDHRPPGPSSPPRPERMEKRREMVRAQMEFIRETMSALSPEGRGWGDG